MRDGLVRLASEAGVELRFGVLVRDVTAVLPENTPSGASSRGRDAGGRWGVRCDGAADVVAHAVVLATGGLSVPATGSDGVGLRIAERLGHQVHETYPALTPLTADPPVHAHLAGVSLTVTLTAPLERGSFRTRGGFLFTHRGYSGPSVLDISHLAVQARRANEHTVTPDGARARDAQPILVQWTEHDAGMIEELLLRPGAGSAGAFVRRLLPQRLADTLLEEADVPAAAPLAQLRRDARTRLVAALARYDLPWSGDEGYKKAEVTGGGVALGEVDPRTLESRLHPGLFLCGEMLDAFGPIGGYNFAWAFATGRLAGRGASACG